MSKAKNKSHESKIMNKYDHNNTEFANEFGSLPSAALGNYTRDAVKIAEAQLAAQIGADPTPDPNSKNK